MIRRLRSERGTVLATTVILMSLMTLGGLATYAYVDSQTVETGRERVRETSFNLGEGMLGSQVFILSRRWPGSAPEQYPTECSGAAHEKCPDGAELVAAFGGPDVAKGVVWQTRVLDNKLDTPRLPTTTDATERCKIASAALPSYYDDAAMTSGTITTYDENSDCRLWVRAQAAIDGRRRTFVGLVRVEQTSEEFPRNVITAGHVAVGNHGNKVMIDTQGDAAQPSSVVVRCSENDKDCVDDGKNVQISPRNITYEYPNATALSPEALERLRERAQSLGTYYTSATGCPPTLAGPLVYIETADIECTGNTQFNTEELPGVLIIGDGRVHLKGTTEFYGIIHVANASNSSDHLVETSGNALIKGAVTVDGAGGVFINASKENLVYDPDVFARVVSFGNAGIIQNTWREIVPAS